ncbi:hypothetical protein [Nitratireductor indicus]|nr:hypothetical protein [Nitratireductor indicus]MDS1138565.1 hypothetical protein [Nitratireductor indicus]
MRQQNLIHLSEVVALTARANVLQKKDLGNADVSMDERLVALEGLLASPFFKASDRNRRFLKFVIEETVAGRADRIKAFTIAVDVFGRDASFDATVDPIVRIAAGQLRKSLRDYYDNHGKTDLIRIGMPLGAYIPSFERSSKSERFWQQFSGVTRFLQKRLMSLAILILPVGLVAGWFYAPSGEWRFAREEMRPVVIVDSARTPSEEADIAGLSRQLNNALWVEFARHNGVRLVGVRADENLDSVVAGVKRDLDAGARVYKLMTTVQREGDELNVYWHLVDARSRETYYSSYMTTQLSSEERGALVANIAERVEASLFRYGGVMEQYSSKAGVIANNVRE